MTDSPHVVINVEDSSGVVRIVRSLNPWGGYPGTKVVLEPRVDDECGYYVVRGAGAEVIRDIDKDAKVMLLFNVEEDSTSLLGIPLKWVSWGNPSLDSDGREVITACGDDVVCAVVAGRQSGRPSSSRKLRQGKELAGMTYECARDCSVHELSGDSGLRRWLRCMSMGASSERKYREAQAIRVGDAHQAQGHLGLIRFGRQVG